MIVIERTVDISKPVQTETLRGNEFTGEQLAHTFKIHATRDGVAVPLTGTVTARFFQANGASLLLAETCGLEGGAATVQLVKACYDIPGRFALAIYHTENGEVTCIYSAVGSVVNVIGDPEYDPGNVIGGISTLIDRANQAAEDAQDALDQASNIVSYADQSSESHTDAQKAQARTNIGAADVEGLPETPVEHWDTDGSLTKYGWTLTRVAGCRYQISGAGTSESVFCRIGKTLGSTNSRTTADGWVNQLTFETGVQYRLSVRPIGGAITAGTGAVRVAIEDGTVLAGSVLANVPLAGGSALFTWPDAEKAGKIVIFLPNTLTVNDYAFRVDLTKCVLNNAIPSAPATDGTYTLRLTVTDGVPAYAWVSESAGLMSMAPEAADPTDESEE